MKKILSAIILCMYISFSFAQGPNIPIKASLSTELSGATTFNNPSQKDLLVLPFAPSGDYTLEIKAKVASATGRGLDVDTRAATGKGFRTSLDATSLDWTVPLVKPVPLTSSDNTMDQVFRYAVKGNQVHIYQNGVFITSKNLVASTDINDNNVEVEPAVTKGSNLIADWANTTGDPTTSGWGASGGNIPWNTTNSGSGARFLDVSETKNKHTHNSATYNGRIFFIRWDGEGYKNAAYTYPVTLEANKTYQFSFLYGYWSNAQNNSRSINVGISKTADGTSLINSATFSPDNTQGKLNDGTFTFTSAEAGQYYLTFKGAWALYSVAQLAVNAVSIPPQLIVGKNYLNGAVDIQLSSVTYEDGAFAPTASTPAGARQMVNLNGNLIYLPTSFNTDFIASAKMDVHFTGDPLPFANSSISLNHPDAWLFIDNIKPSDVISSWQSYVTINGQPLSSTNARIAMYANGTVIIPYNNTDQQAVTFYTAENYGGSNKTYEIYTFHNNLGAYDNVFRSFKLKRGYMLTVGSNADGLGFSKVYIADMHDIDVPVLPKGLYDKTSFIRVFRWDYVSKKGWAGGAPSIANVTWNYDWNVGGNSSVNTQYVPIRQNGGWPSFNDIYNKQNTNTLLGFNEPDHTDQANMTVDEAIQQWPQLMKSGFRLASPAPSAPGNGNNWLKRFMDKADSLNYRVDIAAIHCYWNSRVSGGKADSWYSGLMDAYNSRGNKRPIWITEWNNGANWTGEAWPSDSNEALAKQAAELPLILQVLDSTSVVERYAIYNWVENKRAMILADTLTPAGKIYATNKSQLAYTSDPTIYKPANMYDHQWRISAPIIRYTLSSDYSKAIINWLDINGDLGTKYVLERKKDGESGFTQIAEFNFGTDYPEGSTMTFEDEINYSTADYRLYAISYEGNQSWYSGILTINVDPATVAPILNAEALSSSIIKLDWAGAANARSYNLKRSTSASGPFVTIGALLTGLTYTDENLAPNTTYYYTISSVNTRGESADATPTAIATKALTVPNAVEGIYVASGDQQVTLTWDFAYDAVYDIARSDTQNGTYTAVVTDFDGIRYTDGGLTNNQTYYYKITAKNSVGNGTTSIAFRAQPKLGQHLSLSFNENNGFVVHDAWGGYHGTLKDEPTWGTGKDGAAVSLSSSAKSYLQLENGVVSTLNDFTIAAWVKLPANQGNNTRLFDFGNGTGTFMILVPKTATGMRYKITCSKGSFDVYAPVSLPLNEWTQVAITQEGVNFKFFINGELVGSGTNTSGINPSDMGLTTQNYLGRSQWPSDPYSEHSYDDFKIYNYALSESNVNALYNQVLPVELVSFDAVLKSSGSVMLNWRTASETNNDYFLVEHSLDGENFDLISKMEAKGDAYSYTFNHGNPATGTNYYRLIQVDKNGTSRVVGIKAIKTGMEDTVGAQLYPNPISGNVFYISYPDSKQKDFSIGIYSLDGRLITENIVTNESGIVEVKLKTQLPPGIYLVKIQDKVWKLMVQ